jgi:hypothetical protein
MKIVSVLRERYGFNSSIEVEPGKYGLWGWDILNQHDVLVGFRPEHSDDEEFAWGEQNELDDDDFNDIMDDYDDLEEDYNE